VVEVEDISHDESGRIYEMEIAHKDWIEEAKKRYETSDDIAFKCPSCGHIATVKEWKDAGADEGEIGFSCIGRRIGAKREALDSQSKKGPCNYAGGGLIRLNPVKIVFDEGNATSVFDFADDPLCVGNQSLP
jgi:hypothetical protein